MCIKDNPIMQDNPADTIRNVQCMLIFLQEFYMAVDLPERPQDSEIHTGLHWVLKCADHALSCEMERIHEAWKLKEKTPDG